MENERTPLPYIIVFYCVLLAAWQIVFLLRLVPDYLFPSPAQVILRLSELAGDGLLWPSIRATLGRIIVGFTLAAISGILAGLAMGTSVTINACLKSLFLGLLTLPTAAWTPIALMLYGLAAGSIYFVIFMSSMPAVAIATSDAIRQIPAIYIKAAQTLGTPAYLMPIRVTLPAALPGILTGLKLGWTLGWHGAVSAELIKSSIGLGYLLHMGRELNDSSQVIGTMALTIIIGLMVDRLIFRVIERRVRMKRGLEK